MIAVLEGSIDRDIRPLKQRAVLLEEPVQQVVKVRCGAGKGRLQEVFDALLKL